MAWFFFLFWQENYCTRQTRQEDVEFMEGFAETLSWRDISNCAPEEIETEVGWPQ